MKDRMLSIFIYAFIGISSVIFFCIALLIWATTILFDRRLVALHLFSAFWAGCYLKIVPAWHVSVIGNDKINNSGCYVIVSNHLSQLDIPVAFQLFRPFKWVSKAEVFNIPFIGWNMSLNRYIKLKRGDRVGVKHMLLGCEKALSSGSSIFIFPEGTRSADGNIGKFSNGAFTLAKKMNLPILPVVIKGSHQALPKHSLVISGHHDISIEVLDPIAPETFAEKKPGELANEVKEIIAGRYYETDDNSRSVERAAA